MSNPWMTANPFMSMWLSTANQLLSTPQAHAANMMRRQAAVMRADFERDVLEFWSGGWMKSLAPRRRK